MVFPIPESTESFVMAAVCIVPQRWRPRGTHEATVRDCRPKFLCMGNNLERSRCWLSLVIRAAARLSFSCSSAVNLEVY